MVPTTTNRNPPVAENRPTEEPRVELSMYNVTTAICDRSAMILLLHLDMQTLVTFLKSQTTCYTLGRITSITWG